VDPGEAANTWIVPLRTAFGRDAAGFEPGDQGIEPADPQVDHEGLVGGEIVGVVLERREHGVAALGLPHPFVGLLVAGAAPRADPQFLTVPGVQRIGIARPEEQPADPQNLAFAHGRFPFPVTAIELALAIGEASEFG
jgi:hypothetical protein